jgi:coenzyme F420-0:L-glutamate ligase/coenzyme F420-1:gamma-L-glutamate ligase
MSRRLVLEPITGIGEIEAGDPLGEMIATAGSLRDGDVVVIAQKVVSKAEGMKRSLSEVSPSDRAIELGVALDKNPALVELILGETRSIIRSERVLIVETLSGLICANAGIDSSNVGGREGEVLLLPRDPDASARRLRIEIADAAGVRVAVIIGDSFGRPWRVGQSEVAIGCAGVDPLADWRSRADRDGRKLEATLIATADEIAAAADLARDKASGIPAVIARGLSQLVTERDGPGAASLQRDPTEDLFR